MSITELYSIYCKHPNVIIDSRKLSKDCIYWALKGERFDGNDFAELALEQGAAYAVTDRVRLQNTSDRIIFVEDTLKALQDLANYHAKQLNIPILAITGTNGKTTTKELTAACLSKKFRVGFTQGNLNNHIGVPLTLLSFTKETQIGVVEMGANHQFEIDALCRNAEPGFGLITNIGTAHIEGFGSQEIILKTKTELYRYIHHYGGIIFQNADDHLLVQNIGDSVERHSYSQHAGVGLTGTILAENPLLELRIELPLGEKKIDIKTKLIGKYNAYNCLAAATVANYFGVNSEDIKAAIEAYTPSNNRSQLHKTEHNTLILDAYNANPTSMTAALETLAGLNFPKKVAILGDMLELGEISDSEHEKILNIAIQQNFDVLITVGEIFFQLSKNHKITAFRTTTELSMHLEKYPFRDSLILLKASRGIGLEAILPQL